MKRICPNCLSPIDADNVNIEADLAKCTNCSEIFRASELAADVDLSQGPEPPAGSRITFTSDGADAQSFSIPRRAVTLGFVFQMLFFVVFTCGIALWTRGAAEDLLFASLSLPFWVAVLYGWCSALIEITGRQELRLGPDTVLVIKKSALSSKQLEIPYGEIDSIDVGALAPDGSPADGLRRDTIRMSGWPRQRFHVTIAHGANKTHVGKQLSATDTKWLVNMLQAVVFKRAGKRM